MQLNELQRLNKNKSAKRVARGGKRGKTAGRGTKGQKARAGHRLRPELRDIIKKFPKNRGYRFKAFAIKATPVNLSRIEASFVAGDTVSPDTLLQKKVISRVGGKIPQIKILATGKLTKKILVTGCEVSESAKEAIISAGGSVK